MVDRRVVQVGEQALGWGAKLVDEALEHVRLELANADGYPSKTPGASDPVATGRLSAPCTCRGQGCDNCAPSAYTATERAAERRTEMGERSRELQDAVHAWYMQWNWIVVQARQLAGERLERIEGTRCSGAVDATCTNLANDHRVHQTNGSIDTITDLCSLCFLNACKGCHRRAPQGRYIHEGDQATEVCEACYRRDRRAGKAA